jgi:hypothetical protein
MPPASQDELFIAPRAKRSVGIGGAVLRALAVMAVLDIALVLVAMQEAPYPLPWAAQEVPGAVAEEQPEAPPAPQLARAAIAKPELGSTAPDPAADAAATVSSQPSAGAAAEGRDTLPAPPEPAKPEPALAAPAPAAAPTLPVPAVAAVPQAIPAVATVPAAPAEAPSALERVVLPTAKPQPPAAPAVKPAARRAPHAHQAPKPAVTPSRGNLVPAAAPRALEATRQPPPCKPYTAETTLAGEARPVRGIACPDPNGGWRIITERAALD